jgi:hypothetical protein
MKLKFAGRSGLRVHLSDSQLKQLGDLALRAVSNSVMPAGGVGVSIREASCQEDTTLRVLREGRVSLTVIEQYLLQLRQRALVGGSGFDAFAIGIDIGISVRSQGSSIHEIFQRPEAGELRKDVQVYCFFGLLFIGRVRGGCREQSESSEG